MQREEDSRRQTAQPVRKMMCTPLSVSTAPLISPTLNAIVASSNGFCICPGPNSPRSPPRFALEQSETLRANASKVVAPLSICSLYAFNSSNAASFVCAIFCERRRVNAKPSVQRSTNRRSSESIKTHPSDPSRQPRAGRRDARLDSSRVIRFDSHAPCG